VRRIREIDIQYSEELIDFVNSYNDELESIAGRIINLKIDVDKDMDINYLYGLQNNLFVINSIKSRRNIEEKLYRVILEYEYILEKLVHPED
jgi:hypothetical protein